MSDWTAYYEGMSHDLDYYLDALARMVSGALT